MRRATAFWSSLSFLHFADSSRLREGFLEDVKQGYSFASVGIHDNRQSEQKGSPKGVK
jgi:hypothetical protein